MPTVWRCLVSEELASRYFLETSLQLSGVTVIIVIPISQMGILWLREPGLHPGLRGFMS